MAVAAQTAPHEPSEAGPAARSHHAHPDTPLQALAALIPPASCNQRSSVFTFSLPLKAHPTPCHKVLQAQAGLK